MNNFKMIDEQIERYQKMIEETRAMYAHMARVDAALAPIAAYVQPHLMMLHSQILVRVKVDRIKDVEPLIASLESALGIEFDKTHDTAEYSWREFKCSAAPWIRVDAELKADGPECRRVIVGYETVPKYELKCGEEASTPDAQPPKESNDDF